MPGTYKTNLESFEIRSNRMKAVYDELKDYAVHGMNCLLYGPTGSGKEFLAQYFYKAFRDSHANSKGMFELNCAGISSELARSELFGHVAGAFTDARKDKKGIFELARNGVIFLDEIGELPKDVQSLLLRAMDPGEATKVGDTKPYMTDNVVVVGATDKNPETLLPQLYYRFEQVINVPGLEDRKEDILPALEFFVEKIFRDMNIQPSEQEAVKKRFTQKFKKNLIVELLPLINKRMWKGNFRMLYNTIHTAIIRSDFSNPEPELTKEIVIWFIRHADRVAEIKNTDLKQINRKLFNLLDDHFTRWKKEEKQKWAQVLSNLGNKSFMRSDIEEHFDMASRTLQLRLQQLTEAGILKASGQQGDLYNLLIHKTSYSENNEIPDITLPNEFKLPVSDIDLQERQSEIEELAGFFNKTDHLFISGGRQCGKTTLAVLLGKALKADSDVFYFEFSESGLSDFIHQLKVFLIQQGYKSLEDLPFEKPFMLHAD
ncbi:MAG: sigma 54-interacting transcriptional regulator, partial [Bacteroidales bacterium]|nr:sigma 54-interacting transcriptional regulator [Bacteroidales bacterium]